MSRPQQWTKEEAAVLLHGLLQIINCDVPRSEVIKQVSADLRKIATLRGQVIDDIYRNENGITFQLASMESAYYGKTIMKPATNLFVQVVDLYRNNRIEFDKVLKGALDMLENRHADHEENFMTWLSKQVSPMQLSELYGTYREIEEFCLRVKTINSPLFSSVDFDRSKKIKNTIENNKVFRFSHRKHMGKYIASATHFMHYCKTLLDTASAEKEKTNEEDDTAKSVQNKQDEALAQKYPIIYKKVKAIVCATSEKLTASDIKSKIGAIARLSDIEYIISNATWGYGYDVQAEEAVESASESTTISVNPYFSHIKMKSGNGNDKAGEAIRNWDDVVLISERLVAKNKLKDNLLFVILVNTGLTVDTVLNLKFSDFLNPDKSFKECFVISKIKSAANSRDESGEYPINKDILAALFLYIQAKVSYNLNDFIFVGESHNNSSFAPFSRQTTVRIFAGITQEIDGKYNVSARTLKKTYDYHFASSEVSSSDDDSKSEPIKLLSDIMKIKSLLDKSGRYRDRLLFAIGLGLGMSGRDLMKLRFKHIINDDGSVKEELPLFGNFEEGECEFYIETSAEIRDAVMQYSKFVGINDLNDFVFKSEGNHRTEYALAANSILRVIKSVVAEADVNVNATTLTFKKTFLYHQLMASGGSSQMKSTIRRILRHSSFSQTLAFLCADEKEFESTTEAMSIDRPVRQESQDLRSVDFTSPADYSYSTPVSFTYFDQKYQDLRSWTDLYVKLFTCLYEDYPHILKPGMSFSRTTGGRIELTTEDQQMIMFAPKKVANTNLVLETNISASNMISKVRFWLEICNVDFENVEINYVKKAAVGSSRRTEEKPKVVVAPVQIVAADEKYKIVLQDRFKKGYRLGSGLDLKKFKRYYHELHGVELHEDDNTIGIKIRNCGIVHEEKLFIPEVMLSDELKDKLFAYISDEFAQGKKAIYYEALFRAFSEQFLDYYIYDAEMLKAYLAHYNNGKYHITSNYIAKEGGVSAKPYDEVKDYLIGAGVPVDAQVVCEVLSHIPSKKIMQILGMNAEFVNNGKSYYFHVSVINLSQEELDNIAALISDMIEEKEFISGNELVSAIKAKYPYIIDNNQNFSALGMRDAIKYNLQDRFSFSGNVISGKGKWMSMADVFANYAKGRSVFDIAELVTLAEEMNSSVYFEAVYENSLRISQSQFVSKEQAQFHVHETDMAIDRFCNGKYIPIKAVTEFGSFPDAGFPWNPYLLAHYVYSYSKRYKLLTAGFNRNTSVGAIVSRNSGIESFDDFLAIALAEGNCILKKENALNFLVDQGYLARRNYSNIEKILIQANAQRNMKGTD